jgi:hypothetical protein
LVKSGSVIDTKHVRFLKPSADQIPEADEDFYPELKTIDENQPTKPTEQGRVADPKRLSQEENDTGDSEDLQSATTAKEEIQDILSPRQQQDSQGPQQQPTRALRDCSQIKPPVRYGFHHYYEPNTFESAIQCANQKFW